MVFKSTVGSSGGGGGSVNSVTGLNTDNADPANPVVRISVDGATITGAGTPASPLVAATGGGGTVTTTGSPASGNLTKFSGATSVTNGDLSGDATTNGSLVATVARINGAVLSTTTPTSANLLIGSGIAWATQPVSGDASLSAAGALTVTKTNGVAFGTLATLNAAPANTLTGTTLGSSVVTSFLTSVGTLGNLTVTNPISGSVTGSSGSATGNAGTATALQNPRTINAVAFDGTVNIVVPAAAASLTGTTIGTAIVNSSLTQLGTIATAVWHATAIDLANYVSGNLDTSHLNSGTSASGTTFWRGDGTWATPAGTGVSSISGTTNRITSTGGTTPAIDISGTYSGQSSITTLGTVTVGVWSAGNVNITTVGGALSGDFSNATIASRVTMQSNVTNGNTNFGLLPNGTATTSAINAYNNSNPTNASFANYGISATAMQLTSNRRGSGTILPMTFNIGGTEAARIDTTANVGIANSSPGTLLTLGTPGSKAGAISFAGATSGTITLAVPAVAGTNTITLPAGTTDFSATGGTSQVLQQVSAGAAITVGQLAASDLSNGTSGSGAVALVASPAFSGTPTVPTASPGTGGTQAASQAYVDAAVQGTDAKDACKYASTGPLPSIVYANGSSGVGATLTGVALAAISLDSSSPSVSDRVLIKNQVSTFQNGIYSVTATGSGIAVFVLTRTTDFDQSADIDIGDSVFITAGATLANTTWVQNGTNSPVMGTDPITFSQIAGPGSITSGNGITVTGLSVAIDTSVTVDKTTAQTLTNKTLTAPVMTAPVLGTPASGVATNLTGTATTLNIGGNAATATALATGRAINGVTFDGTAAITVPAAAGTLTGTTLGSSVVTSFLTQVGTVTLGAWSATFGVVSGAPLTNLTAANISAGTATISVTGSSGFTLGNAVTATAFQTPRTINNVTFDGTANISIAARAASLSGTTIGSAVVSSFLTQVGTLGDLTVTNPISGSVTGNAGTATAVAVGGITGLGTGVVTALAINIGTAGSPIVNGGILGTPSSGVATNVTGLPATTGIVTTRTSYTPSVASTVGTITTSNASGAYIKIDDKLIWFSATTTITTNGTGAGKINVGLPFAVVTESSIASGIEIATTGKFVLGYCAAGGSISQCAYYDASYPGASGNTFIISGVYRYA